MRKILILGIGILFVSNVFALQVKNIVDNETTTAKISSVDVTRIFVQGDRIKSLRGIKGAYTRENDESNGEVYIQPTGLYQERPFTILIDTENGKHFTLLLTPISAPSETLMLVPKGVGRMSAMKFEKASPYELTINHLIKAMKNGEVPEGYSISEVDSKKSYQFGDRMKVRLKTIYSGVNFIGQIFEITNLKNHSIDISEKEFYKTGTNAISLDAIQIPANEKINLYRVVSHD